MDTPESRVKQVQHKLLFQKSFRFLYKLLNALNLDIDDCQSNLCVHGSCMDQLNEYKCACDAGYTGEICQTGATILCFEVYIDL